MTILVPAHAGVGAVQPRPVGGNQCAANPEVKLRVEIKLQDRINDHDGVAFILLCVDAEFQVFAELSGDVQPHTVHREFIAAVSGTVSSGVLHAYTTTETDPERIAVCRF